MKTRYASLQIRAQAELERRKRQASLPPNPLPNITNSPQFVFRGAALALQSNMDHEVIISGPSETGKTIGALKYIDTLCRTHANLRGAMVRKVRDDMNATVIALYRETFVDPVSDVRVFGGEHPEFFQYQNGSRIWVAGIDRPGKVLSGALDFVYFNQVEESQIQDWETLSTRTTGRRGILVPGILLGDANPGDPTHWILDRAKSGTLKLLESRHEDNPSLFDDAGQITERGRVTMGILEALTGVRKERLRFGRWVRAEGVVYEEYDPKIHLIDRFDVPPEWRRYRSIDFGFTNPFSCSWWAQDHDGRLYRYRQLYVTGKTVSVLAQRIKDLSAGERIETTICDHDAEDRATLEQNGIPNEPAIKDISRGIQAVKDRLKVAGDKKPRIYFLRGSLVERDESLASKHKPLCTEDELVVYAWPKAQDGKPIKETPIDEDNHGLDETRYMVMHVDNQSGTWVPRKKK